MERRDFLRALALAATMPFADRVALFAAREQTKNLANYLSLGVKGLKPVLNGAAQIFLHGRVYFRTTNTGANDNALLYSLVNDNDVGFSVNIDGTTSVRRVRCSGRSGVIDGTRQGRTGTTDLAINTWHAVGGLMDIANDSITPYANGVAENSGAATFGNTTYTYGIDGTALDCISTYDPTGAGGTVSQIDGFLCELGLWVNWIPTTRQVMALAAGRIPPRVQAANLACYWPLVGNGSTEQDLVSKINATIVGSIPKARHARSIRG